jgi:EmrB/QacA subfamily drug resistance transporter
VDRSQWTLAGVCVATFMLLLDITIVNVALPAIQEDLDASLTSLQWVIDAYALMLSALILTAGALADRLGRRRIFSAGVLVFTVASLACGLAGDPTFLALARGAQGIGGAAMFATSLALIAQEFEGPARAKAIAAWGATVGFAVAVGPLVGGALTDGLGWEWIFFVNLPIGALAFAVASLRMREYADPDAARIDVAGLVTFAAALFLLVLGLLRGNQEGWGSAVIVAALAGSLVLLVAFVVIERRQERPMLDLSLFRNPAFAGVSIGTVAIGAGMFAMLLYISLYLQNVLGYTPFQAGLRFLPLSLMSFLVPLATQRLTARLPARAVLGSGLMLTSLGLLLMHGLSADSDWTALLAGLIVGGIGIGLSNPAIGTTALAVVHPARSGMASGFSNTCRIGGVATGIAALGAIFDHQIASKITERLPSAPEGLPGVVAAAGPRGVAESAPAGARGQLVDVSRDAFVSGLDDILLVGAATLFVGAVAAALLIRDRYLHHAAAAAPAASPGSPS